MKMELSFVEAIFLSSRYLFWRRISGWGNSFRDKRHRDVHNAMRRSKSANISNGGNKADHAKLASRTLNG